MLKHRRILLYFLIIFLVPVFSPESGFAGLVGDSLTQIRTKKSIDSLIERVNYFMNVDYDSSRVASEKLMKLSDEMQSLKGKVKAMEGMALYQYGKGNYVKAIDILYQRLEIHQKYHLMEGYVTAYSKIAGVFYSLNDTVKVLEQVRRGFEIANLTHNPEDRGLMFLSKCSYHYMRKEYSKTKQAAMIAAGYFIQSKNIFLEARAWRVLGDAFLQTKQLPEAIDIYLSAIRKFQKNGDLVEVASLYTRVGHVYSLVGDNNKVLYFNRLALNIREKIGIKEFFGLSLINIGGVYEKMNQKDSAFIYLQKGIKILEKSQNLFLLANVYKQLSIYYSSDKKEKQAFHYYKLYRETNQAAINKSNNIEISKLNASWELREKEQQNRILRQENALQEVQIHNRTIQTILFEVGFLIFFFLTLIVEHYLRINKQRKKTLQKLNENLSIEIRERIDAENQMRQSELRYRFLAEHLADVISVIDASMKRIYISPSCERLYGYSSREILDHESMFTLVDPDFHEEVKTKLTEMIRNRAPARYYYKAIRKDGTNFWAESNVNPVFDPETGSFKEMITIVRDISERKKFEERLSDNARQKSILLREIHNRVKNNFAILTSLMTLQCDVSKEPELIRSLSDLQIRLRTMSLVHEQLYKTQGINTITFGNYLNHLAVFISSAFRNDRITLIPDIEPCELSIETTLPLGLIVNELLTNAYKYAFPDDLSGHVWVTLKPRPDHGWCLSISDDGIGLPSDFSLRKTQSMGSQIIQILIEQVEAKLEIITGKGSCFRIYFST